MEEVRLNKHLLSMVCFGLGTFIVSLGFALVMPAWATPAQNHDPADNTTCLNCHIDQERLTKLAPAIEEEQLEEALSSGPG